MSNRELGETLLEIENVISNNILDEKENAI